MHDIPLEDLLHHAETAARIGGAFAMEGMHRRGDVVTRSQHDVKIEMDVETQERIAEYLRNACPGHHLLGEEGGEHHVKDGHTWIVDPIDGTMNYFHDIPHWCCSVAIARDGEVVAGAVYSPTLEEMYTATMDGPALRNGEKIRVSDVSDIRDAILVTGGLARLYDQGPERLDSFFRMAKRVSKVRILGAAALDLCFVACGRMDVFYEYQLNIWDTAAACLIAGRAGAVVRTFDRESDLIAAYLVSVPALFDEVAVTLKI